MLDLPASSFRVWKRFYFENWCTCQKIDGSTMLMALSGRVGKKEKAGAGWNKSKGYKEAYMDLQKW